MRQTSDDARHDVAAGRADFHRLSRAFINLVLLFGQRDLRHLAPPRMQYTTDRTRPSFNVRCRQCPTYFAYSVFALSGSSVPLMIARPSGKTVNWYSSTSNLSMNLLKVTLPSAMRSRDIASKSSLPATRWLTCTALRPHRR